jgi:hypothetical protein
MFNLQDSDDLKKIILTASKILNAANEALAVEVLRNATIEHLSHDNWNGGIDSFILYLTVDVDIFISFQNHIINCQTKIMEALDKVCGHVEHEVISSIRIVPGLVDSESEINETFLKREEPTFWKPGYFKLFISHLAAFKKKTSALKNALEDYGVSAFVAHEDIEPTKEWQFEIEQGLFTMEALCAILMEGFNLSKWTDQEVGVALGRDILVIPIRKGLDPYGFIGKYQGFQAENKTVGEVARAIFDMLSTNQKTSGTLILKLSELFLLSTSSSDALLRIQALKLIKQIPRDRVEMLRQRITENETLKSAKVLEEFNEMMRFFGQAEVKSSDFEKVVAGQDDDLPF